tara:strand:+ start:196 stop:423 length:228 start_codon:yes stop_codon:yes gene_type:complete
MKDEIPKPPKLVIAVIDGCFTKGKEYNVKEIDSNISNRFGYGFLVVDDNGLEQYCLEKQCAHMANEDWIIKEREL